MKKQLLLALIFTTLGSFAFAQDIGNLGGQGGKRQYYRIVKIQTQEDIPEGSTFIGYVPGKLCGITGLDDVQCAVVTAEPAPGFQEGKVIPGTETFYYLAKTNRGARQTENFVAYVQQQDDIVSRPGAIAVGIYKANN